MRILNYYIGKVKKFKKKFPFVLLFPFYLFHEYSTNFPKIPQWEWEYSHSQVSQHIIHLLGKFKRNIANLYQNGINPLDATESMRI